MQSEAPETSSSVIDLPWVQLRKLEGRVMDNHLIPFLIDTLPDDLKTQAIADVLPEDFPESIDKQLLFHSFFLPWIIFNWIPGDNFGQKHFNPDLTVAQNYVSNNERCLSSKELRFIESMNHTYYSFYSVQNVERHQSLVVKDILLGTEHLIKERQGTETLKRGDLIFSRILNMNDQSIFIGMAPFTIPNKFHSHLLDVKEAFLEENDYSPLSIEILSTVYDEELVINYFDLIRVAYHKPMPTILNTDGEPLQISKSYFTININPEEALKSLLPMTLSESYEEFVEDDKLSSDGSLISVDFPWLKPGNKKHSSWENTVLGHITIEKDKLTLETNSESRTQKGRTLLEKHLGDSLLFKYTVIESIEKIIKDMPEAKKNSSSKKSDELMQLPEVQEKLHQMAQKHWESWFDISIPALNDKTPREAAKTESGRERLDALLLSYERNDEMLGNHPFKADIKFIKNELGMAEKE